MSYPLLLNAPPHESPEFITYLREHNVVLFEDDDWILIENCKYHKPDRPWYTAFTKQNPPPMQALFDIIQGIELQSWTWLKKAAEKQTVPQRFHIHIFPR